MKLFERFKKRKKKQDIEEFVEQQLAVEESSISGISRKYQAEHEAVSCCEQMIADSRELEETKKEYRLVTDYLNDIQIIEDLPEDDRNRIKDTAQNIVGLHQKREDYSGKKKRLSDTQYLQMEQLADEMPENIRRLQANESYQSMIKRDMDSLEGEKSEWSYYLESLGREQKFLKLALWAILGIFVIGISILLYVQYGMYRDMTIFMMLFLFAAAVSGCGCILRLQNDKREQKRAELSINRAITISNQMKAKYVNVTNAVDYACEKYHVKNSMELNYIWEQYMEAAREHAEVIKNSEDLEYFSKKLVRDLRRYQLYDAAIWMHQANAIVDKREMVEVKHFLLVRRQKLRTRMEQQVASIQASKQQLLRLIKNNKEYQKEIQDVLTTIDEMCGL